MYLLPSSLAGRLAAAVAAVSLSLCATVRAAPPERELRIVVGFGVGTGPDTVARAIGRKLGEVDRGRVVVDNRPGAGGQIAAQGVAGALPDGHTLLLAEVGSIAIAPAAFGKLAYRPAQDLVVLSEVARSDFVLAVPVSSAAYSVADFVADARAKGGSYNIATFGPGTPSHFGAELFAQTAGFKMEAVHYRLTGDAVIGVGSGDVQGVFITAASALAPLKAGKVRLLATTASRRLPQLPDVPTFAESGYPKVEFAGWFAFFVPAATPRAVQHMLALDIVAATRDPEVTRLLQDAGFSVLGTSQADAVRMVQEETQRWARVVKASGFKIE